MPWSSIGVANYSVRYLKELLLHVSVVPSVNQIKCHPSLPQQDVVDFCHQMGIHIIAYSAFGSTGGPHFAAPPIVALAEKKHSTPAKVLLSWHSTRGSSVLVRSNNLSRIKDNCELINLDEDDCALIRVYSNDLCKKGLFRRYVYPPFGIDLGFPDAAM
ncbi:H/ACA snoRNP pseudouridylase subunit [Penicillium argentinense]|uniref:H/ACA snoRNP pseudouridylase subunit n=1 Tax=Penicillium argentinense TaxID=1131581 RepID=A0A9W9KLT8_9EURO|nr:H/ACA snoRNP pseudouridylase subunit [Penicillium argentinense]KAJ5110117.1 H/ACA snoRNP pseudouridylase subunit [Penicillium argentinense]